MLVTQKNVELAQAIINLLADRESTVNDAAAICRYVVDEIQRRATVPNITLTLLDETQP